MATLICLLNSGYYIGKYVDKYTGKYVNKLSDFEWFVSRFSEQLTCEDVIFAQCLTDYGIKLDIDQSMLIYKDKDFCIYKGKLAYLDVPEGVGYWVKKRDKDAVLVKIEGMSRPYSKASRQISRVPCSTKEEWYSYVMNYVLSSSLDNHIKEKYMTFFEENKDRLSVFDYKYYLYNCKINNHNRIERMMDKIEGKVELITNKNVDNDELIEQISYLKHSKLDDQMKVLLEGNQ